MRRASSSPTQEQCPICARWHEAASADRHFVTCAGLTEQVAASDLTPLAPIDLAARFASASTRIATEIVARVAASGNDTVVPTIPLDEIFQQQAAR